MLPKSVKQNEYIKRINPINWSISTKLLIALFSAATIPMSLVAYNSLKLGLDDLEKSEYHKLETIAVSSASRLDQLIIDNRLTINQIASNLDVVEFLAAEPRKRNHLTSKVEQNLNVILRSSPDYDAVFVIDQNGICVASTNPTFIGQDYSFRDYFKEGMKNNKTVPTSLLVGATSGRPGLFFAHPIRSKRGDVLGIAVLKIQDSNVLKIVNSTRFNSHVQAFLIDELGIVIAHPNSLFLYRSLDKLSPIAHKKIIAENSYGSEIDSLELPQLAKAMVGAKEIGHVNYYSSIYNSSQMAGFSPLQSEPWVLGVNKPKAIFEAPMRAMIWDKTYFIILVGGVAIGTSLLLSRQLVRPINDLMEAEKALQKGDFNPEILAKVSRSNDDLGRLACVFIQMAEEIQNREYVLKSQVEDLRVEIDEVKKERQIEEITGTEYFKELQKRAKKLKKHSIKETEEEAQYFQNLNKKVKDQKTRFVAKQ